ncbi:MAG: polymorphic toxin type 43 domain-containing protein [Planctomycetota bacterium]|nr:polymorphic toxin type 43 domain-containing protein [Planctomycetota bacterium]
MARHRKKRPKLKRPAGPHPERSRPAQGGYAPFFSTCAVLALLFAAVAAPRILPRAEPAGVSGAVPRAERAPAPNFDTFSRDEFSGAARPEMGRTREPGFGRRPAVYGPQLPAPERSGHENEWGAEDAAAREARELLEWANEFNRSNALGSPPPGTRHPYAADARAKLDAALADRAQDGAFGPSSPLQAAGPAPQLHDPLAQQGGFGFAGVAARESSYPHYSLPGYRGQLHDAGTGEIYLRNRQYNPALGRFTAWDPIGYSGGLNTYNYAGGDPVNRWDPMGTLVLIRGKPISADPNNAAYSRILKSLQGDQIKEFERALISGVPELDANDEDEVIRYYKQIHPSEFADAKGANFPDQVLQVSASASNGATDVTVESLNWSMNPHMDIPGEWFGSPGEDTRLFGNDPKYDRVLDPAPDWSRDLYAPESDGAHALTKLAGGTLFVAAVTHASIKVVGGPTNGRLLQSINELEEAAAKVGSKGSGPARGVIEVSRNSKSYAAFRNYSPKQGGIEFVFDPSAERFLVGKPKDFVPAFSNHQKLAYFLDGDGSNVVGGMFRRGEDGSIILNQHSGHYWRNWTPEKERKLKAFLEDLTRQKVELGREAP